MRYLLLIMAFSCCLLAQPHPLYDWKVTRVLDGDTVEVQVDFLPRELGDRLLVRIWGVDTPEKGWRAKSEGERQKGLLASMYTKELLQNAKVVKISIITWDKYGGRVLGDILIDGVSLRESLLKNGYAREYYGDKKADW